jgi:hypothetical protein
MSGRMVSVRICRSLTVRKGDAGMLYARPQGPAVSAAPHIALLHGQASAPCIMHKPARERGRYAQRRVMSTAGLLKYRYRPPSRSGFCTVDDAKARACARAISSRAAIDHHDARRCISPFLRIGFLQRARRLPSRVTSNEQ